MRKIVLLFLTLLLVSCPETEVDKEAKEKNVLIESKYVYIGGTKVYLHVIVLDGNEYYSIFNEDDSISVFPKLPSKDSVPLQKPKMKIGKESIEKLKIIN